MNPLQLMLNILTVQELKLILTPLQFKFHCHLKGCRTDLSGFKMNVY